MTASLFLVLVCVYVISIAGIVVVSRLVETPDEDVESLEQRLADVRGAGGLDPPTTAPSLQYFVRAQPASVSRRQRSRDL